MARRQWSEDKIRAIRDLISEGHDYDDIAKRMGITNNCLRGVIFRYKIDAPSVSGHSSLNEAKKKAPDLCSRLRILQGLEVLGHREEREVFSDDQLRSWLDGSPGCGRFVREVMHQELQGYQSEMVSKMLGSKRFVAVCGRQSGKDYTCACFSLWRCITVPDTRILVISASQRQSDLLLNRIFSFIANSLDLFSCIRSSNMEVLRFTNGSEIVSLPGAGLIRGFSEVDYVLLNEARDLDESVLPAVSPMLSVKDGHLCAFSTPSGCSGLLWDMFNNPLYSRMNLPTSANRFVGAGFLEREKATLPAMEYAMEYEAQFQEYIDNFFPRRIIDKCSFDYELRSAPEPDKEYFCGVDWGRFADSSVITIVSRKGEDVRVEDIIELQGKPFPVQEQHIIRLHGDFRFRRITLEQAGLSLGSCDVLKEKLGGAVDLFKPTIDSKEDAYSLLKSKMENGHLTVPRNHRKLQFELSLFQYEITSGGKMKLFHLSRASDDFCDSLAYAVWATRKPKMILVTDWIETGYGPPGGDLAEMERQEKIRMERWQKSSYNPMNQK